MIFGIGVDVTSIIRIETSLQRFNQRFAHRVLHPQEREAFTQAHYPARFLAKRFAIKEAASKALGTGIARGVRLHDFVTHNDALGKPQLHIYGVAAHYCAQQAIDRYHVSLSDEGDIATAFVIFEMTTTPTGSDKVLF